MKKKLIILAVLAIVLGGGWHYKNRDINANKYINKDLGFEVTLPVTWKDVRVEINNLQSPAIGKVVSFTFPTNDPKWPQYPKLDVLDIHAYPIDYYNSNIKGLIGIELLKLGENSRYVFAAYSHWLDLPSNTDGYYNPSDLGSKGSEVAEVSDSFKAF